MAGENTGRDFIKKIRPAGAAVFLVMFVVVTAFLFTSGRDPIKGYEAPNDTEYYLQNAETMDELCAELEQNVFPHISGIVSCGYDEVSGTVSIVIEEPHYAVSRSAILWYYDNSLFTFTMQ